MNKHADACFIHYAQLSCNSNLFSTT